MCWIVLDLRHFFGIKIGRCWIPLDLNGLVCLRRYHGGLALTHPWQVNPLLRSPFGKIHLKASISAGLQSNQHSLRSDRLWIYTGTPDRPNPEPRTTRTTRTPNHPNPTELEPNRTRTNPNTTEPPLFTLRGRFGSQARRPYPFFLLVHRKVQRRSSVSTGRA